MMGYYKELIMERIDKQINKGLNKYGMTLEDNTDLTFEQRVDHIAEELIDGLQYLEHLKVCNAQNVRNKQDIVDAVGSLIFLSTSIQDEEIRTRIVIEIRKINNAVKNMK